MILYLAGPDIFLPDARAIGDRKKALCRDYGFEGLYPLDLGIPGGLSPADTAMAIYQADTGLMQRATAIVANLSPFRGKPAFGYSTDARTLQARTTPDGATIEDFGLAENLMVDCALRAAGAPLVTPSAGQDGWWCFEQCLIAARGRPTL